jgi:hypothetical protein
MGPKLPSTEKVTNFPKNPKTSCVRKIKCIVMEQECFYQNCKFQDGLERRVVPNLLVWCLCEKHLTPHMADMHFYTLAVDMTTRVGVDFNHNHLITDFDQFFLVIIVIVIRKIYGPLMMILIVIRDDGSR